MSPKKRKADYVSTRVPSPDKFNFGEIKKMTDLECGQCGIPMEAVVMSVTMIHREAFTRRIKGGLRLSNVWLINRA